MPRGPRRRRAGGALRREFGDGVQTRASSSQVSSRTGNPHSRRRCATTSAAASLSGRPRRRMWRSVSERSPSRSKRTTCTSGTRDLLRVLLREQLAHAAVAVLVVDAVDLERALVDVVGDREQVQLADQPRRQVLGDERLVLEVAHREVERDAPVAAGEVRKPRAVLGGRAARRSGAGPRTSRSPARTD